MLVCMRWHDPNQQPNSATEQCPNISSLPTGAAQKPQIGGRESLSTRKNQGLTTDTDEARIKLLVADRTKRKLVQLKAITNRTIASLQSGLKAFNEFVTDIDKAVVEQTKQGAVTTLQVCSNPKLELMNAKFDPKLSRIVESPLLVSCQASSVLQETINLTCEPSIVLESVPELVLSRYRLPKKIMEEGLGEAGDFILATKIYTKYIDLEEELSSPIQFNPPANYECKPGRESSFFGGQALTPVFTSTPKPEKVSSAGRSRSTIICEWPSKIRLKRIEEMLGQEKQPVVEIEQCKNISAMVNGMEYEPVMEQTHVNQAEVPASAHKNITERCRRTISNESSDSSKDISASIQSYSDSALRRRKSIFVKPMAMEETDSVVDDSNPSFKSISSQASMCSVDLHSSRKRQPPLTTLLFKRRDQKKTRLLLRWALL
uniref:Shugoshin C-terminal domain-containing protein n=1 Tax=Ditylenchus dipsaci TaxID=166011 RepID=A0A915DA99_9BILA